MSGASWASGAPATSSILPRKLPPLALRSSHPDVRWSITVPLDGDRDGSDLASRCLRVWRTVEARARALGVEAGSAAVHAREGTLLLVREGPRVGAALVRPGGVVSVARYELREALRSDPEARAA